MKEDLTVAYIAIGAHRALVDLKDDTAMQERMTDQYEGQLGIIGNVIEHAALLDTLATACGDSLHGVFVYEVAEQFGYDYIQFQFENGGSEPNPIHIAFDLLKDIT